MTTGTSSLVQRLWNRNECLYFSGVHYPDDSLVALRFERTSEVHVTSSVAEKISAADFASRDENLRIDLVAEEFPAPGGRVILVGEGSGGSEGFVAVCSKEKANLIWLAFFDFSNPFEEGTFRMVDDQHFAARTNHQAEWLFSIDDPTRIVVTRGDFGWPRWDFWPDEIP